MTLPDGDPYARPDGVSDATIDALGTLGEAVEWMERARGHLFEFHQMMGRVDLLLGQAADGLADAGAHEAAERLQREMVGRNVLDGRWTFQIVDEYDAGYYRAAKEAERRILDELVGGRKHIFEAEMKERRRTPGDPAHSSRPATGGFQQPAQ